MLKQFTSWLLASSLILMMAFVPAAAGGSKAERDAQRIEKVKAGIARLGIGSEARVAVKLKDGKKIAGYVMEASADYFVIGDLKTGASTTVPYPDVAQVKGHHLSKGAKIAIIALSIGVGVLAFFLWLENAD